MPPRLASHVCALVRTHDGVSESPALVWLWGAYRILWGVCMSRVTVCNVRVRAVCVHPAGACVVSVWPCVPAVGGAWVTRSARV